MTDLKTIEELMEGVEPGGIRIVSNECHMENEWFRPYFPDKDGNWVGLNERGEGVCYGNGVAWGDSGDWKLYEEQEYKTINDLMAGKEYGEIKIARKNWSDGKWMQPIAKDSKGMWRCFYNDESETWHDDDDHAVWKLVGVIEARYQWAHEDDDGMWCVSKRLLTNLEASSRYLYRRISGPYFLGRGE